MLRLVCKIDDIVGISIHVVKLIDRLEREKATGDLVGAVGFEGLLPYLSGDHLPKVVQVLAPDDVGHVILDVHEVLVANRALVVETLIHAFAETEGIGRLRLGFRPHEDVALHDCGNVSACEAEPGLRHVQEADQAIHGGAGCGCGPQVFVFFRNANDERCVDAAVKQEAFAAWQHAPVIGIENDNGIFREPRFFQVLQCNADLLVHVFHGIVVLRVVHANAHLIRVVLAQRHFAGRVAGAGNRALGVAFVRFVEVDHLKERLPRLAQVPGIGLVAVPASAVGPATNVVISLGVIGREVARLAQVVRVVLHLVMRDRIAAAHGVCAHGDRIDAGDPGTALGGAHGGAGKGMRVAEGLPGKGVDVRRFRLRIAVTADPVDAGVFANKPQNVGTISGVYKAAEEREGKAQ